MRPLRLRKNTKISVESLKVEKVATDAQIKKSRTRITQINKSTNQRLND